MDRLQALSAHPELIELYLKIQSMSSILADEFLAKHERLLSFGDMYIDRWEKAKKLGFGEGSSVYDNVLVIGDVKVGKNCWIGPNTILDGSGGLSIGDGCTISAGVHLYTHDNIKQTLSNKKIEIERNATSIGNNVYIAPNVVVAKGVNIGHRALIGAFSLVNKNVEELSIVVEQPAKAIGKVIINDDSSLHYEYFK